MTNSEIILYSKPQGEIKIEVILQDETVWLTQRAMGELFGVVKSTISEHLSNIYKSGELEKEATVRKIRTVHNAVLIINPKLKSRRFFIKQCKTNCIGQLPDKLLLK